MFAPTASLVFCYGSNLSRAQMRQRCPRAVHVGTGALHGYRLAFRGSSRGWGGAVATVVPSRGRKVVGTLFVIGAFDLHRLDRCEGHPWCYERREMRIKLGHKRTIVNAWVYERQGGSFGVPSNSYLDTISKGYDSFHFDKNLLTSSLVYSRERMYDESQEEFPWGDDALDWEHADGTWGARTG